MRNRYTNQVEGNKYRTAKEWKEDLVLIAAILALAALALSDLLA